MESTANTIRNSRGEVDKLVIVNRDVTARKEVEQKLGRDLEIEVAAQGIEKTGQCEALRELGCRLGQGYLFSAPIHPDTATHLLREQVAPSLSPSRPV